MSEIDPRLPEMAVSFTGQVRELFDQHTEEIQELLNDIEPRKVKLAFSIVLDLESHPASVETTISFSKVVKDRRTAEIHGADEPPLPGFGASDITLSDSGGEEPPTVQAAEKFGIIGPGEIASTGLPACPAVR